MSKPSPRTLLRVASVVDALARLGFQPHGSTESETVRVPTARAPVFGGLGGELRTFGGRTRFILPDTDIRATVGPRTTFIYRVIPRDRYQAPEVVSLVTVDTADATEEMLRAAVEKGRAASAERSTP